MKKYFLLLVSLIIFAVAITFLVMNNQKDETDIVSSPASFESVSQPPPSFKEFDKLPGLVDAERIKAGLSPLIIDPRLGESASNKCAHAQNLKYWAHDAPDGTKWPTFIDAKIKYKTAGENLAYDFDSSDEVIVGWMGSIEHKKNILNSEYTHVGYALCESKNYPHMIVQHFISL